MRLFGWKGCVLALELVVFIMNVKLGVYGIYGIYVFLDIQHTYNAHSGFMCNCSAVMIYTVYSITAGRSHMKVPSICCHLLGVLLQRNSFRWSTM